MTGADLCRKAMQHAMLLGAGNQINGNEVQDVMDVINMLFDLWNAKRGMAYAETQYAFTFTANLNPHTIGPTGTFVTSQRPVSIEAVSVIDTSVSPHVYIPIEVIKFQQQASMTLPSGVQTPYPKKVFYETDYPNGKLYFYPTPSNAYGCNIWARNVLASMLLTDTFTMPPGYEAATVLTAAEMLCPMWEQEVSPELTKNALDARMAVFSNNIIIPNMATCDAGMPSGAGRSRNTFLWQDGLFSGGRN